MSHLTDVVDVTADSTARDMALAIRAKHISARELLDLHLARIAERNPQLNAIVSLDEERARQGAAEADEATARGRPGRIAARAAARLQGHPRRRGLADDVRLTPVRRPRPRRGRPPRRADPPGRGGHDRQDQRAGVRGRVPHVQQGLRDHPQPRRPHPLCRRLVRGSGLCSGVRDGAAGRRFRHGRVAAQPRELLRSGRAAADDRPGAGLADRQLLEQPLHRRPDGPQRRGPRAAAVGDRRPGPELAVRPGRPGPPVRPAGERHAGRPAGRPVRRPRRRDRGRRRGRRRGVRIGLDLRRRRRHGGGGGARPVARRRRLPYPPRLAVPGGVRATSSPSIPTRSSPRWPTTSAQESASRAPTWLAPSNSGRP